MSHRNHLGYLLACCLSLSMLGAIAQQRTVHQLLATGGQLPSNKLFHAVIHEIDPGAQYSFQDDRVKVMIDNTIPADDLVERLLVRGLGTFTVLIDGGKVQRQPQEGMPEGFPTRMDTGNPAADEAAYLQAKQAWILANPQAYDLLNQQDEQPALRKSQSMEE
jgi:hypothetical protein